MGEAHDVDGGLRSGEQVVDGFVQGGLAVVEVEGHGSLIGEDRRDLPVRVFAHPRLDDGGVPEGCRHQQEHGVRQGDQRDLPRDAALAIVVEVEFVLDDVGGGGLFSPPQAHVRQHLRGAADDGRVRVDAGVAGEHSDVRRAEIVAQVEELLAGQRLDGRRVERPLTLAHRLEVEAEGHQRLARTRGRSQHHVAIGHQLEERLFLVREGLEPEVAHPVEETTQDLADVARPTRRDPCRQ